MSLIKKFASLLRDKDGSLSFAAIALIGTSAMLLVAFIAFYIVMPNLSKRQKQLEADRNAKQQQLDELTLQNEYLRELSSINESQDFLVRYLRETQGYIKKGDIRIDLDDPNATIPTPMPAD